MKKANSPENSPKKARTNRPVALKDIAAEFGVSSSLVSKVISGRLGTTKVRDELRKAILEKANELKYSPNPLATALKKGRLGSIGLIVHPVGVPGSQLLDDLLKGISHGLDARGFRLWLRFFEQTEEFFEHCTLRASREIDGLIVAGIDHPETHDLINQLDRDGLPVVTVFQQNTIPEIPNICTNHQTQGYIATRHMLEKGCQRIGYVNLNNKRFNGYEKAFKEAGKPIDQKLIYAPKDTPQGYLATSAKEAADYFLSLDVRPDAIIAQSDHQAAGIINELYHRKVKVPQEIKVVGFDNSPVCDSCITTISSVTAEMEPVGRRAVDLMMRRLEGEKIEPESIMPQLVERESTH